MKDALRLSVYDKILTHMNREGAFSVSVLVSEEGWPVAQAPSSSVVDGKAVAAMMALGREFVGQTRQHLGLGTVDEVSIVIDDRSRLVCRYFTINNRPFVLVVMAQPGQTYRRLTTKAIQEIIVTWNSSFASDTDDSDSTATG